MTDKQKITKALAMIKRHIDPSETIKHANQDRDLHNAIGLLVTVLRDNHIIEVR